ncbi:MAG TPA: tetratricopeptide repeat protein [Dyadobacter sp.]|jgi:tetratricopeptide (TPR) repeat protein|nr:tetratricopeptide repeat protein [Dyadobacter sp.]
MNFQSLNKYLLNILVFLTLSCGNQKKKDAADFFLKANREFQQKNYTEALRLYDEAINKNSDFADAFMNKGICLMKMGQPKDAYEVLTEAIEIDPTLTQANLVRSEVALILGKTTEADADLKLIEKDYKDSSRYFLIRGDLFQARNETARSLSDYDKAILLDSTNAEALVNRGALYYNQANFELAQHDFRKALIIRPSQIEALNNLGLIATHQQKYEEAVGLFDQILHLNPANALALNNKGYAFLLSGKLAEALKLIDRSLDIMPGNGYALRNLGIYYMKSGETDKALAEFNKAIDIAEPVEELYGLTGQAYMQKKDVASACKIWKQGSVLKDALAISELKISCK